MRKAGALRRIYRFRRIIAAVLIAGVIAAASAVLLMESENESIFPKPNDSVGEEAIYEFLTQKMGFNTAAACGVLANIEKESGFSSDSLERGYTWEQGAGYGICQWTNYPRTSAVGRRTDLVAWCSKNGYDYTSLSGQLGFLQYELSTATFSDITEKLRSVPDNAQGAYDSAYCWCYYFEVPDGYDDGVSELRGDIAKSVYWPKYSQKDNA